MILTYNSTYDNSEYIKVMLNLVTVDDEKILFSLIAIILKIMSQSNFIAQKTHTISKKMTITLIKHAYKNIIEHLVALTHHSKGINRWKITRTNDEQ